MTRVSLVVLCAGISSRFLSNTKKVWLRTGDIPFWLYLTQKVSDCYEFDKIIVVCNKNELKYMKNFSDKMIFVEGCNTRQASMQNALSVVDSDYVIVTDAARVNTTQKLVLSLIESAFTNKEKACIAPSIKAVDTILYKNKTVDREQIQAVQTPQISKTTILKKAISLGEFTDDSSAVSSLGESVLYIDGVVENIKITHLEDMKHIKKTPPSNSIFSGNGIDIHEFEDGKPMVLGGVIIDSSFGFKAHSDGDVLIHSLIDSILGATGGGDIGEWFSDSDDKYKNADSKELLREIVEFISSVGFEIVNVDISIVAQVPRLDNYKSDIKNSIADILQIPKVFVNIKATTSEKLGFIGREEGVCVMCNANLKYYDWIKN
jgi:2-C-methyl-D-erythritol 4-phosphate cytidylyltransferase/2-C-methyl-D-erythritol 2,4-cyclodiphosphate synthase